MDGQQQQIDPFQKLLILQGASNGIGAMHLQLSARLGFAVAEIAAVEEAEFSRLDEKGKETGKKYQALEITLKNGKEYELTDDERKAFSLVWNEKTSVDRDVFSASVGAHYWLIPNAPKPDLTPQPEAAQTNG